MNLRKLIVIISIFMSQFIYQTYMSCVLASELTRVQIESRLRDYLGRQADFSNLDLSGADFSGLSLANADFFSSNLNSANFNHSILDGANFTRSDMTNAHYNGASLVGAVIYAAILDNVDFSEANLTRVRIVGGGKNVRFVRALLINADLGADPANQGMVPVRAELPSADFQGANLTHANLVHAVLTSSSFSGAIVTDARFDYAVLDGSDLQIKD